MDDRKCNRKGKKDRKKRRKGKKKSKEQREHIADKSPYTPKEDSKGICPFSSLKEKSMDKETQGVHAEVTYSVNSLSKEELTKKLTKFWKTPSPRRES